MEIIAILLPLALLLSCGFVASYIWATSSGQYDDLETPPQKILIEEKEIGSNVRKI